MPDNRYPEESRMSKPEFDEKLAEVCENCEQVNSIMGKHVVCYLALDDKGQVLEKLSLCLECRFTFFSALLRKNGLHLRKDPQGRLFIVQGGITLRPPLVAGPEMIEADLSDVATIIGVETVKAEGTSDA